ncbi:AfsR/SARP family transcriptional regulator [Kibdelosporangium philippinense]|uniref:AfsR/SARP family transcriptional regulator n=1 Tax=Kibdelosporangium philippinense TaxID=211113 RepID=UPI00361C6C21
MEFQLLGPVRAISDGRQVDLGVRKQRFVLAMMLLDANKLVPADRLVELTWPDEAPRSARGVIHTHISRLRSVLNAADAERHGVALISNGPGYMMKCDPKRIDVNKFMDLCTEAGGLRRKRLGSGCSTTRWLCGTVRRSRPSLPKRCGLV